MKDDEIEGDPSPGGPQNEAEAAPGEARAGHPEAVQEGAGSGRWYEAGLPFSCTACGNCCKSNGEYSHVYLREEEVGSIAAHLGLDPVLFLREQLVVEDGWISLQPDLPQCQFLTPAGKCGIYEVRPIQCRTWPFWDVNLKPGVWQADVNKICPGSRDGEGKDVYSADKVDEIAKATEDWYEDELKEWPGKDLEL